MSVELLSPAGSYEGFLGAVEAGADAVYFGGARFGARAYATNLTDDEIVKAIHYAHLRQKKVYLTVNTLLKDEEFDSLYEYMYPFYVAGLDGVIVQDFGVMTYLQKCFPKLEMHGSTQMTIVGVEGAKLLFEMGVKRVVPARELSLSEIIAIKKNVPIEIETFIHGAMCYSYSGDCLFSSILGGRSGNRGRCAGPCRLPYSVMGNEKYPMSLKDMCTLSILPELIEAGIDSFKIEGRMKKSEYTAGVTAMYRKYIDLYLKYKSSIYKVDPKDETVLKKLYMRSEVQDGYYHKYNGKEMISIDSPGYSGTDDELLKRIRMQYLEKDISIPVSGEITLSVGKPAMLEIENKEGKTVTVYGDEVSEARNNPLSEASVKKQIMKTGDSLFSFEKLAVTIQGEVFVPVSKLNSLRREGIEALEKALCPERMDVQAQQKNSYKLTNGNELTSQLQRPNNTGCFSVSVMNIEQLKEAVSFSLQRIYIPIGVLLNEIETVFSIIKNGQTNKAEIIAELPLVFRAKKGIQYKEFEKVIFHEGVTGVLIHDYDGLHWISEMNYSGKRILGPDVYCFNTTTKVYWQKRGYELTIPYELNKHEIFDMNWNDTEMCVYGRIPLMVSANCIMNTTDKCYHDKTAFYSVKDRYHKDFVVLRDCNNCCNITYNSIPHSLHKQLSEITNRGIIPKIQFTDEIPSLVKRILTFYIEEQAIGECPVKEYTTGHYKRGVE